MRRLTQVGAGLLLMVAYANPLSAQTIVGSDHDFSGDTWNPSGQICLVCHTPHNADVTVTASPLWNHEVSAASYTLYTSPTLDAGPMTQPTGTSLLCLSCHDGTVAVDNFGGATGGTKFVSGHELIGTDLRDDHPISFQYTTALATTDGGLYDPATQASGLGGTIDNDLLFSGSLDCASCHDVHNGSGVAKLLRKSNAASALCLTCHSK